MGAGLAVSDVKHRGRLGCRGASFGHGMGSQIVTRLPVFGSVDFTQISQVMTLPAAGPVLSVVRTLISI